LPVEHLFAGERDLHVPHAAQHGIRLALVQIETMDGRGPRPRRSGRRPFGNIDHAGLACGESKVSPRRHRQRQNALADALQIHLHLHLVRALVFVLILVVLLGVVVFLGVLGVVFLRVGVVLLRFVFLGVRLLLLVALRLERRGFGLGQHHGVDAGRYRPRKALNVRLHGRARVGAGDEIEILAVLVEGRAFGVAQPSVT
jgi:hypothetical protein